MKRGYGGLLALTLSHSLAMERLSVESSGGPPQNIPSQTRPHVGWNPRNRVVYSAANVPSSTRKFLARMAAFAEANERSEMFDIR